MCISANLRAPTNPESYRLHLLQCGIIDPEGCAAGSSEEMTFPNVLRRRRPTPHTTGPEWLSFNPLGQFTRHHALRHILFLNRIPHPPTACRGLHPLKMRPVGRSGSGGSWSGWGSPPPWIQALNLSGMMGWQGGAESPSLLIQSTLRLGEVCSLWQKRPH